MTERLTITPKIDFKKLTNFMVRVYRGELIPLGGRPEHFEEAELECDEGFVGPPPGWQPNVERDFNIKSESEVKNMDEIKRPIQAGDLGVVGSKIETPESLCFKGLDGKDYLSSEALEKANTEWIKKFKRYISPWTGKEYTDYQAMQRDERKYWEEQIKLKKG